MTGLRMNCRQVERLAPSVADGVATERERAGVDAHLVDCLRCQQTLAETRRLRLLLANQPTRATSDEFERRLKESLAARVPTRVSGWSGTWERLQLRYGWRLQMPALCAAGSLAVVLVAVTVAPRLVSHPTADLQPIHIATTRVLHPETDVPAMDWDAMQASVDLSTGSVLDQ